jgi:hypothetical protein
MTLKEIIADCNVRAETYAVNKENASEARQLSKRAEEISLLAEKLEGKHRKTQVFSDFDEMVVPDKSILGDCLERTASISTSFVQTKNSKDLTAGTTWVDLKGSCERIIDNLDKGLAAAWKRYYGTHRPGNSYNALRSSCPKTPKNLDLLEQYEEAWRDFNAAEMETNFEPADFKRVKQLGVKLEKIYGKIDLDVPPNVQKFLDAIAENGASLSLLTDDVRAWLSENKVEQNYRIIGTD